METLFKKIPQQKVSDRIFEQIKTLIVHEKILPGEQIPPELELTSLFDVSRSSVREAVLKLECLGFVEQRRGEGTFVRSVTEDPVQTYAAELGKNDRFLSGLMEIRGVLETWAAAAAAERATPGEISQLLSIIDEMKAFRFRKDDGHALNVKLHSAITAATQNMFLIHMMGSILDLLETVTLRVYSNVKDDEDMYRLLTRQHAGIVDAIAGRDPQRASFAMKEHLAFSYDQAKDMDWIPVEEPELFPGTD